MKRSLFAVTALFGALALAPTTHAATVIELVGDPKQGSSVQVRARDTASTAGTLQVIYREATSTTTCPSTLTSTGWVRATFAGGDAIDGAYDLTTDAFVLTRSGRLSVCAIEQPTTGTRAVADKQFTIQTNATVSLALDAGGATQLELGRTYPVAVTGTAGEPLKLYVGGRNTTTCSGRPTVTMLVGDVQAGAITRSATFKPAFTGNQTVCAWLGTSTSAIVATSAPTTMRVVRPDGTLIIRSGPGLATRGMRLPIKVTSSGNVPRDVHMKVLAPGTRCVGSTLTGGVRVAALGETLTYRLPIPSNARRTAVVCAWVKPDPAIAREVPLGISYVVISTWPPCVVPRIAGAKVANARIALVRAGCRVGTTRFQASSRHAPGVVISTSSRPGTRLPALTPIRLVVSR